MPKGKSERDGDAATTRRGRPRSVETTNAILESAYALMATTGLAATTIDAIARDSNVSKMTIYKWWPSREALLIDAFLNQASMMLPLSGTGKPATRLKRRGTPSINHCSHAIYKMVIQTGKWPLPLEQDDDNSRSCRRH